MCYFLLLHLGHSCAFGHLLHPELADGAAAGNDDQGLSSGPGGMVDKLPPQVPSEPSFVNLAAFENSEGSFGFLRG